MRNTLAIGTVLLLVTTAAADDLVNQYVLTGTDGRTQHVEVFREGNVETPVGLMTRYRVELFSPNWNGDHAGLIGAVDLSIVKNTGELYQVGIQYTPDTFGRQGVALAYGNENQTASIGAVNLPIVRDIGELGQAGMLDSNRLIPQDTPDTLSANHFAPAHPSEDHAGVIAAVDLPIVRNTSDLNQDAILRYIISRQHTPDMFGAQHLAPAQQMRDSHFLLNAEGDAWSAGHAASTEDNDWSIPEQNGDEGFGDLHAGPAFITNMYKQERLPFAQVVLPFGTSARFAHSWYGGLANGYGEVWNVDGLIIGLSEPGAGIPEPGTVCLLAMGGLVLCRRRRK